MKLSELQALCEKAITKHGDMPIGVHPRDEAVDVGTLEACYGTSFCLRIISSGDSLPGEPVDKAPKDKFAVFFYEEES